MMLRASKNSKRQKNKTINNNTYGNKKRFSTIGKTKKKDIRHLTPSTNVQTHISIHEAPHGVLVRDFIRESLYSKQGYFNSSRVINSPGVINFGELMGKSAYEKRLQMLYYSGVQGWTTPVEIFQPFYAQALARYFLSFVIPDINKSSYLNEERLLKSQSAYDVDITDKIDNVMKKKTTNKTNITSFTSYGDLHVLEDIPLKLDALTRQYGVLPKIVSQNAPSRPIHIVEMGAGNGTAASNILDYMKSFYPKVYKTLHYTILEMSDSLSWQQRELLETTHPEKYTVHTVNAAEYKTDLPEASNRINDVLVTNEQKNKKNLSSKSTSASLIAAAESHDNIAPHYCIFGLEVLDNMVHDKVIRGTDGNWYQINVATKKFAQNKLQKDAEKMYIFGKKPAGSKQQTATVNAVTNTQIESKYPLSDPFKDWLETDTYSLDVDNPGVFSLSASALSKFINDKPLPIDYKKLNINPQSSYIEYALPIIDPTIKRCIELHHKYMQQQIEHLEQTDGILDQLDFSINERKELGFVSKVVNYLLNKKLKVDSSIVYLPTELLRTFDMINTNFPSHTLILADFDMLPTTETVKAINAPVVAHKESSDAANRGKTNDEPSYLVKLGLCDIFFPTDFRFTSFMYNTTILNQSPQQALQQALKSKLQYGIEDQKVNDDNVNNPRDTILPTSKASDIQSLKQILNNAFPIESTSAVIPQDAFLGQFAETERTSCKNGFNPMLQDYTNMAIFIGQRK